MSFTGSNQCCGLYSHGLGATAVASDGPASYGAQRQDQPVKSPCAVQTVGFR
jgi:hypothetical protein